ncbi:MAG: UDP-N-acetylmuramoyl-L-alanyl-D-glutamate--2,6-diaminopimelate ligase, partial [Candidatus Omnitrophica bacterium]|nr:UDP-N-acetylmuramoyl-L-alanyl-D-glutamate--2,6-diaminopimelate ligase [Candidatus Omnitrophota bacterium]
ASRLCEQVILTSDNPRSEDPGQIIRDIQQGISKTRNNYQAVPDRFQAIQQALLSAQKNDLVVIAGKGHESTQIFADQTIHFNDREVIEQILQTSPCLPLKRS